MEHTLSREQSVLYEYYENTLAGDVERRGIRSQWNQRRKAQADSHVFRARSRLLCGPAIPLVLPLDRKKWSMCKRTTTVSQPFQHERKPLENHQNLHIQICNESYAITTPSPINVCDVLSLAARLQEHHRVISSHPMILRFLVRRRAVFQSSSYQLDGSLCVDLEQLITRNTSRESHSHRSHL